MNKALLSIATLSCLLLFSCSPKQAPPAPPTPVNLYTIASIPVVYYDNYPSTTVALSQVNLLPQVQGYITEISFKEGSHVTKGQKLYVIDRRLYEANDSTAVANLKVTKSNLEEAQQDADRYSYLNTNDAVAKQTYDHAMIALQTAKDQVHAAEAAVKTSQTSLGFSIITAPFDGTIGFSQVKLGDLVNVGLTVLNTVSTDDPMAVDFLVNEKQLPHFEDIQNSKTTANDSLFTITLPNGEMYPGMGEISVIDRAVDPQTGTIRVRLVFPNPKFYLRAGMSCVVNVRNQDKSPQMLIPNKAIVEQMGEFFVYVAKDSVLHDTSKGHSDAQDKSVMLALQKKVKLGATIGPNVIVKSGITDGDKIVVDGLQSLHNGSQINPADKPAEGKSANASDAKKDQPQGK